jgi:hypothetical protein
MRTRRVRALPLLAFALAAVAGSSAGCTLGCPTALATGTVAASGSDLILLDETGAPEQLVWPDGYGVRRDGDALVLTDRFGTVKARVGDRIELGGGVGTDDQFHGCGEVVVVQPPASTQPS